MLERRDFSSLTPRLIIKTAVDQCHEPTTDSEHVRHQRARTGISAYYVRLPGRASRYRGATIDGLDEPVQYDENGQIMTTRDDNGVCREGLALGSISYWDPSSRIKVCAFDAQENLTGVNRDNPNRQVECICQFNSMGVWLRPSIRTL